LQVKDEAWWLVLGNTVTSELYAVKRVSFSDHLVTHMDLPLASMISQVYLLGLFTWFWFMLAA